MNSSANRSRAIVASAILLSALAAVLRILCLLFFYDKSIGYYSSGAALPIFSTAFFALCSIACVILPLILFKNQTFEIPFSTSAAYTAVLPSIMLTYQILTLLLVRTEELEAYSVLTLIFSIVSVAFFMSLIFSKQPSSVTLWCGIGFIIWLALSWIRSYSDFFVPMNSPDKLFSHLAYVGAALLVVGELRSLYGIAKAKIYLCYISLSILTLSSYAIPSLVGKLCGAYADNSFTAEELVFLALTVYATVRAVLLLVPSRSAPTDEENSAPCDVQE